MLNLSGREYGGLQLRVLNEDQAEEFFNHIEMNRSIYSDTIPFVSKTHSSQAMLENIRKNLKRQVKGEAEFYTLWDDSRMAGYFLVREKDIDAKWAEIGYMLGQKWHGRGIAKEICKDLILDLFKEQGMNKVVICCNDDNIASIWLAKKLSFVEEGNIRDHYVVNGVLRNMLGFGLLKREWKEWEK